MSRQKQAITTSPVMSDITGDVKKNGTLSTIIAAASNIPPTPTPTPTPTVPLLVSLLPVASKHTHNHKKLFGQPCHKRLLYIPGVSRTIRLKSDHMFETYRWI